MPDPTLYPRFAASPLTEALSDSPVVLIHGPRQCGKTTLAKVVGERLGYGYFSFDDAATQSAAESDPVGFVDRLPARTTLDEVQRVPALFAALKVAVDRERQPGRFLLTGSANVLLVPALSDSLAGRMAILRLHPLAQCELERHGSAFLDRLFEHDFPLKANDRLGDALIERILRGGYPAALARSRPSRRAAWYRDYIETMVQRDARDLARIASLDALPRLLTLAASQTARLINVSDLSSPFQLSRPTIRTYVNLLERLFLLEELPPWHSNRLSRLVKTPKLHIGDTGLACSLMGLDVGSLREEREILGQLVETFAYQELRRQASWHENDVRFHHYRDRDGVEVDVILERGARDLVGVEVKASATVTPSDFRGLRRLKAATGKRMRTGVVLYDGENTVPFGENLYAIPLRALWEASS